MARPKTIEESVRVSVVMSKKQLEWIQHMGRKMSVAEGRTITASEAIRLAIENAYPVPKSGVQDMFEQG